MSISSVNDRVLSVLYRGKFFVKTKMKHYERIVSVSDANKAMVIGNGPSLNETIQQDLEKLKEYDCFMVNQAVESPIFELIKPLYYVLADGLYFNTENFEKSMNIVDAIKKKLTWQMYFIVPDYSVNSYMINELKDHPCLKFIFFNSLSLYGFEHLPSKILFEYWNNNLLSPLSQTVLNTAVCIAIEMKYNEVGLVGADTSWIELLEVDQKTNDLYSKDKHFYDNDRVLIAKYDETRSNMAHELTTIVRAFESYQILKEYATYNGCKLFNASKYSLIDCIDRIRL